VTFLLRYWKPLAVIALLLGVWTTAYMRGYRHGSATVMRDFNAHMAADEAAALKASEAARKHEQQDAANSARIAEAYEKGKQDAETASRAVVAGLRAGTVRLRKQWQGCEADRVSATGSGSAEPDAAAADRAESAGRIVRAAREADEQIKALQDVLRGERK
jgi:hypothetical protein